MLRTCESCVHHKVYPFKNGNTGWFSMCSGVTWPTGESKRSEWLDDLSVANECIFYDEDSWTK